MNYDRRPTEQRALVLRLSWGMQPFSAPVAVECSHMAELSGGAVTGVGRGVSVWCGEVGIPTCDDHVAHVYPLYVP